MSLRAKRRNKRLGVNAKRKGVNAVRGGSKPFVNDNGEVMHEALPTTPQVRKVKVRKPFEQPKPFVPDPRSIRERLLETHADEALEFEKARAKWHRWEGRKQKQRQRSTQAA